MTDRKKEKFIAVASGKGGVGKTWLAITLSHMLSRMGRKVLLFDGDLGLANVDIQLGLMPEKDLGHVIMGALDLEESIVRFEDGGFGTGGFDVLAGRSGTGALSQLSANMIRKIRDGLDRLATNYDHVIMDLAAGVEPAVLALSEQAGTSLVVLTPDPTSLTDAYAFIKMRAMRDAPTTFKVVVNMAGNKRQGEKTYQALLKACENFLHISPELAGIIKTDSKVADAIRCQLPLLSRHPQADAADAVAQLTRALPARQRA